MNDTQAYQDPYAKMQAGRHYQDAGLNALPEPSEPSMTAKAKELLGHLNRLSAEQYRIRERLLGPDPRGNANEASDKRASEPSLSELLWQASQIAACLCGEASTILSKL